MHHNLEISTSDPLKYEMVNSILILSTCIGKIHQNGKGLMSI